MQTINYDVMKIKLELVFRLLQSIASEMRNGNQRMTEIENELSRVGSIAVSIIFQFRHEGTFQMSEAEHINGHAFGQVVFDHFMNLQRKIAEECTGLPITISITRNHLLIMDGMDELIELIKELSEKKESHA
jgi:hypothetical protein